MTREMRMFILIIIDLADVGSLGILFKMQSTVKRWTSFIPSALLCCLAENDKLVAACVVNSNPCEGEQHRWMGG